MGEAVAAEVRDHRHASQVANVATEAATARGEKEAQAVSEHHEAPGNRLDVAVREAMRAGVVVLGDKRRAPRRCLATTRGRATMGKWHGCASALERRRAMKAESVTGEAQMDLVVLIALPLGPGGARWTFERA